MSTKIIIYIAGKPTIYGYKRREFVWSEELQCHVYGGRPLELTEFNEAFVKCMKHNRDMNPRVKVIDIEAAASAPAPALQPPPIVSPVATISAAREIGVEEAVEVLLRLAPEKLKKGAAKGLADESMAV